MNIIVATINQKKCNFCFNWIVGTSLSKSTLNCCDLCLRKYTQKSAQVRTVSGQCYKMLLLKEIQHSAITRDNLTQNISDQNQEEISECSENESVYETVIKQHESIHQQELVLNSSVISTSKQSHIQKDKLRLNLKKINHHDNKSVFMQSDTKKSSKTGVYQSCFLQIPNKQKPLAKSMNNNQFHQLNHLEDSQPKVHSSRNSDRYKFYYDHKSIKQLKNSIDNGQRQFGDEIGPNSQRELFSNVRTLKTSRSGYSNQNEKLFEEQLRLRISSYIESHYHTPSLHKPMTNYIKQAYEQTNIHHKTLQLTSFKVTTMDLSCYLNLFDFKNIQRIKLVNVGLTDQQLPILIEFISNKHIETLVLSGNKLTETSLEHFLKKSLPFLKQIYLGKNSINKCKTKQNIAQLHSKFKLYL